MPATARLLICYDVTDDRRRDRLARLLEDHGRRVQYSVFECDLDEARLVEVQRRTRTIIDQTVDSVRFYRLCLRCCGSVEVLGAGPLTTPARVAII